MILKRFAPIAIKTGSFAKLAGVAIAATPWSILAGVTYFVYRKTSKALAFVTARKKLS